MLIRDDGAQRGMMKKNLAIFAVLTGVLLPGGNSLLAQEVPGRQLMQQDGARRNITANDDSRLPSDQDIQRAINISPNHPIAWT